MQAMIGDCSVVMSDYCNEVAEYIQGNIEESRIECGYLNVDSAVFESLHVPAPTVTAIDFCQLNHSQVISLRPDVVIATDVVSY